MQQNYYLQDANEWQFVHRIDFTDQPFENVRHQLLRLYLRFGFEETHAHDGYLVQRQCVDALHELGFSVEHFVQRLAFDVDVKKYLNQLMRFQSVQLPFASVAALPIELVESSQVQHVPVITHVQNIIDIPIVDPLVASIIDRFPQFEEIPGHGRFGGRKMHQNPYRL